MGLLVLFQAAPSYAQQEDKFLDTAARVPPELLPQPFIYKGFKYQPQLTLRGQYDSNLFSTLNDQVSDYSLTTSPQLSIGKEYGRFSTALKARADIQRFSSQHTENQEGYAVSLNNNFDINSRWSIPFNFSYLGNALKRGNPVKNLAVSEKPITFETWNANAGIVRRFNRLSLSLIGDYSEISFQDGRSLSGLPVVLSDNDRSTMTGTVGLRYDLLRGDAAGEAAEHYLFANAKFGHQDHRRLAYTNGSFSGLNKDRDTLSAMIGFKTGYKGLLNARLGVGILNQYFEAPTLDNTSTYDFSADIDYALTRRLNLAFAAGRDISQDNDLLQGMVMNTYNLGMEYEIRHDLYSSVILGYASSEFEEINREDSDYSAGLELQYFLNPHLSAKAGISHVFRDSSDALQDYDRNILMFSITGSL